MVRRARPPSKRGWPRESAKGTVAVDKRLLLPVVPFALDRWRIEVGERTRRNARRLDERLDLRPPKPDHPPELVGRHAALVDEAIERPHRDAERLGGGAGAQPVVFDLFVHGRSLP